MWEWLKSFVLSPVGKAVISVIAIIILIGIYFLVSGFFPAATRKTRRTTKKYKAIGKEKKASGVNALDDAMRHLSKRFVRYVKLNKIAHSEREKALRISGMSDTPEEYTAYILTVSGVFALLGILCAILGVITQITVITIIAIGMVVMAFVTYFYNISKLSRNQSAALRGIESELPRFVSFIDMNLEQTDESILSMLERYTATNETFAHELAMTIADAKTSSFDSAMARLDQRVNSNKLKQIIHGLVSANNGDDVRIYFAMLARDMSAYEIAFLRSNVQTIPSRMMLPKILMYLAVAVAMFFPLIMQIIDSFRVVFTN